MIQTAKNVFSGGLVMDFAPDNTSSDTLTSALNATITTFNGNEMTLLNDMGNARVETAYLPEGYVPVGTCEYGDIIYIVSYNPLINKSLIGCFPSPERNISTEEVVNGIKGLLISLNLFLEDIKPGFGQSQVKATSAKCILTNKNLNPGDKYIIYTDNIFEELYITDIGNTDHNFGEFPKYLKIHVISIDNSNKIDYLDTDVIWYDKVSNNVRKDYFINEINKNADNKPDIDSYRNALSSGYSVFQSKVSGKLALLVELETIDTFSCTYNIYKHINQYLKLEEITEYLDYDIYFNINWGTNNYNINPSLICLYNQNWSGISPDLAGKVLYWEKNSDGTYYILKDPKKLELSQLTGPNLISSNQTIIKAVLDADSTWEDVYKKDISRSYLQESLISYEEFKTKASYDNILNITLKYIKYTLYIYDNPTIDLDLYILKCELKKPNKNKEPKDNWLETNTEDISLSSVVINRKKGTPIEGEYYINANSVFLENGESQYYTTYKDTEIKIYPYKITDDIINNYFRFPISKLFASIKIPVKLNFDEVSLVPDISNLIYNYEVAPVMPYGILPHLISKGTINFSKIGSGEINITQWKYYNTENTSTLTVGFNIFPEENMGVAGIDIDFLDNLGTAATYSLDKNSSYSGTFTDLIPLNNSFSNYRLQTNGTHAGILDDKGIVFYPKIENDVVLNPSNNTGEHVLGEVKIIKSIPGNSLETCAVVDSNGKIWNNWENKLTTKHINDSGILYSNFLYLAKITVKYCYKNALGDYDTSDTTNFKTFYRWFWTNTMYNDNYYSLEDFDTLSLELSLDIATLYNTENYKSEVKDYLIKILDLETPTNNFGTTQETVTTKIKTDTRLGLLETFDTFSLNSSLKSEICAYIGNKGIDVSNTVVTSFENKYVFDSPVLHPERIPIEEEEPVFNNSYENLYNWLKLSTEEPLTKDEDFEYIDYKGDTILLNTPLYFKLSRVNDYYTTTLDYKAILFSNYYKYILEKKETLPCLKPLVYDKETANKYGITSLEDPKGEEASILKLAGMISMGHFSETNGGSGIGPEALFISEASYDAKEDNILYSNFWQGHPKGKTDDLNLEDLSSLTSNADEPTERYIEFKKQGFQLLRFFSFIDKKDEWNGTGVFLGNPYNPTTFLMYDHNDPNTRFWFSYYDKDSAFTSSPTLMGPGSYIGTNYLDLSNNQILIFSEYTRPPVFLCYVFGDKSIIVLNSMRTLKTNDSIAINSGLPSKEDVIPCIEEGAKYILNLLTSIYVKNGDETLNYNSIEDVVYLEPHKVIFSYSILYKSKVSNVNNSNINIHGIQFSKYLEAVTINLDKTEINVDNTTLKLLNILKNIPIQFELVSKAPKVTDLGRYTNAVIMKLTDKTPNYEKVNVSLLIDKLLYFINSDNKIVPYLGGLLWYETALSYKIDNKTFIIQKHQTQLQLQTRSYSLYDGWEYDSESKKLIFKRKSSGNSVFATNSWRSTYYTLDHKVHNWRNWEILKLHGLYKNIQIPTQFSPYIYD